MNSPSHLSVSESPSQQQPLPLAALPSSSQPQPHRQSHQPPRKRSLSLRRLRTRSFGGRLPSANPSLKNKEKVEEDRPPLPPSHSAYGRLEGAGSKLGLDNRLIPSCPIHSNPPSPPPWPKDILYQRCYCEEGSYLLAAQLQAELAKRARSGGAESIGWKWDVWVVVVSNKDKTVLLWQQKASNSPELNYAVLWDYHLFCVVSRTKIMQGVVAPSQLPSARRMDARKSTSALEETVNGHRSAAREGRLPSSSSAVDVSSSDPSSPPRRRRTRSLFRYSGRRGTSSPDPVPPLPSSQVPLPARDYHQQEEDSTLDWSAWVYDIDSCLCSNPGDPITAASASKLHPVPFKTYISQTFAFQPGVYPASYLPTFRLVRADAFLDNFASDRSHMLLSNDLPATSKSYSAPVPPWAPICGPRASRKGWSNNLMDKWVNMDLAPVADPKLQNQSEEMKIQFGRVLSRQEFSRGRWQMVQWRRRGDGTSSKWGGNSTPADGLRYGSEEGENIRPPIEARRGGRVKSSLFPAYLAASLQARAARNRDSYLALKVGGADTVSGARTSTSNGDEQEGMVRGIAF